MNPVTWKKGLFVFFATITVQSLGVTLTQVPLTLSAHDKPVTVQWQENIAAVLRYGTASGVYTKSIPASSPRTVSFVPSQNGMGAGVYHAVIASASSTSREFKIYIQNENAPVRVSPSNGSTINTTTVRFAWNPVVGVPFYHILVSDQTISISQTPEGDYQLVGANVVWQAITPNTSINYGDEDPSGYFEALNALAPPLSPTRTYNWVVLNTYENNPALSSIVNSGVSSFQMGSSVVLQPPRLIQPSVNQQIESRDFLFQWQSVSGAHHYELVLFEFLTKDDSEASYPVFRTVTPDNSVLLTLRDILKPNRYLWTVYAIDDNGLATSATPIEFVYNTTQGTLNIVTKSTSGSGLPRTNVRIVSENGAPELAPLATAEGQTLVIGLRPGSYTVIGDKEGYESGSVSVRVEANQSSSITLYLKPQQSQLFGSIQSASGQPLDNARIVCVSFDRRETYRSTSSSGSFSVSLPFGIWEVGAEKEGYITSSPVSVVLKNNRYDLPDPIELEAMLYQIRGTVLSQSGQAVPNCTVAASNSNQQVQVQTGETGVFQLLLSKNKWNLQVEKTGWIPSTVRMIDVTGNATLSTPIFLTINGRTINGTLLCGSAGIPHYSVQLTAFGGQSESTTTDARGQFEINPFADIVTLSLSRSEYHPPIPIQLDFRETLEYYPFSIQSEKTTRVISGTVASTPGAPLRQVFLTAGPYQTFSNAEGYFELFVLPGKYRVDVQKPGYAQSGSEWIDVRQTNQNGLNLELSTNSAQVSGTIRSGSRTLSNIPVLATSGSDTVKILSNMNGQYTLALKPALWSLNVVSVGYSEAKRSNIALQNGQKLDDIDFDLTVNYGSVKGTVKDQNGNPIQGATLYSAQAAIATISDKNGRYALSLSPGTESFMVEKFGYASNPVNLTVISNTNTEKQITLNAQGVLTGDVQNTLGDPIWDATVYAIRSADTVVTKTDYAGEFQLMLPGGQYLLEVDQLGYAPQTLNVSLTNGSVTHRNLILQTRANEIVGLAGTVLTITGQEAEEVSVHILGETSRTLQTDYFGVFQIDRLENGETYIIRPESLHRFFIPAIREYSPLTRSFSGQDFQMSYYGDVSGNDKLSSFDGSIVLRRSARQEMTEYYQNLPRDSVAADVSGNRSVSAFDASLIFRRAVGLIQQFPVEQPQNLKQNLPLWKINTEIVPADDLGFEYVISIFGDTPLYSMQCDLSYPDTQVHPDFSSMTINPMGQTAFSVRQDHACFVFASDLSEPASDLVLRLPFVGNTGRILISNVQVNEIPVDVAQNSNLPGTFQIRGIAPNPFNVSLDLFYFMPPEAVLRGQFIRIRIFNILGQEIRALHIKNPESGFGRAHWDGRNHAGQAVASGLYLMVIQSGQKTFHHKTICIR